MSKGTIFHILKNKLNASFSNTGSADSVAMQMHVETTAFSHLWNAVKSVSKILTKLHFERGLNQRNVCHDGRSCASIIVLKGLIIVSRNFGLIFFFHILLNKAEVMLRSWDLPRWLFKQQVISKTRVFLLFNWDENKGNLITVWFSIYHWQTISIQASLPLKTISSRNGNAEQMENENRIAGLNNDWPDCLQAQSMTWVLKLAHHDLGQYLN